MLRSELVAYVLSVACIKLGGTHINKKVNTGGIGERWEKNNNKIRSGLRVYSVICEHYRVCVCYEGALPYI